MLKAKRPRGEKNDGTWVGWSKLEEISMLCALDSNMKSGKDQWKSSLYCFTYILCHFHTSSLV